MTVLYRLKMGFPGPVACLETKRSIKYKQAQDK